MKKRELKDWTWEELIDYCTGEILQELIRGKLRSGVLTAFEIITNWLRDTGKLK